MKRCLIFPALAWLISGVQSLCAQVQVQVMIQPPYPVHYEAYMFNSDQILVQLINTGSDVKNVRLLPVLTGDNGIKAYIKPSYTPSQPIQLAAGQSLLLNFRQLKAYNRNITNNDVALEGTSVQALIRDEKLPEGNYTLCVDVVDYATGALLSAPMAGCAFFALTHFDPPVVILPFDKSEEPVLTPQFVNFSWTATGLPGKTRYRFQMTDITQTGPFDPNDAFLAAAIQPFIDRKELIVPVLNYTLADPPLKPHHTYAVRVQAYDPTQSISFKNNGWGPVSTFKYLPITGGPAGDPASTPGGSGWVPVDDLAAAPDEGGGVPPPVDPADAQGCFVAGAGTVPAPAMGTTHSPALNEEVMIGKFKMKVTQANGPQGKGEIFAAFLKTKIKVSYTGMQVNENGFAVGQSTAWADPDQPNLLGDELVKQFNGTLDNTDIPYEPLKAFVDAQQRKVSVFKGQGGPAVGVPFSLNTPENDLYFLGIEFTPTQARANISLGLSFPEAVSGAWVNLGMKGVIIRPNGFDLTEGKIALAANQQIAFSDKANLVLKAQSTYLTFTCSGVDAIHIDGYIDISRQSAIPANAQGKAIAGNETLKARFTTTIGSSVNWVVEADFSHPHFCLPGMEDMAFSTTALIYDNSGTQNAQGMKFPANHPKSNPAISKTWTGLYMGDASLTLPSWMKGANNQPVKINFQHLLLDKTGIWTSAAAENVIPLGDATLGGWGFSIDDFGLVVESSVPAGGSLQGKLRVPVTETGLGYEASISKGNPETHFLFSVSTLDEVRIDMMMANATFFPNSSITIEKINGNIKPSAMLHGQLEIGWAENDQQGPKKNNLVSSFSLPKLKFQDMHVFTNNNNIPQLGNFSIQLDNPNQKQGLLAGFPLNLQPPSVSNIDGDIRLQLGLQLTLSAGNANGLSGGTTFSIIGKYDGNKKLFVYDRTELNKIALDVDVAVAKIEGEIEIYAKDAVYGNGFRGEIDATIKGIGIGVKVALQVGRVSNYDYFYFDGLLKYDQGFTIPGTVAAIYGFGGGFYYNMTREAVPQYSYNQYAGKSNTYNQVGGSGTGVKFTPQNGIYGFSASVIFGLAGGPQSSAVFNGDVKFEMVLKKVNGGISITKMILEGNGYAIAAMSKPRDQASVKGSVLIVMDFVEPSFTLNTSLSVNVANGIVQGSASFNMHFSPSEWYVHMGRWDDKTQKAMDEPWTDKQRINLTVDLKIISASFFAYFMMGSDMPELPPLPKAVRDRMMGQNNEAIADARNPFPPVDPLNEYSSPGFAFGAGIKIDIDFKVLIFYVDIDFLMGFDVVLKNYGSNPDCQSIGINGWYAKGQVYADINVAAGLELDLWFWEGKFEMLTFHGTAVLEGSFPNPNYLKGQVRIDATALNGLIRIKTNVKFETGKKPECMQDANPFGDYPIVSEISPGKGEEVETYEDIRIAFNFPKGMFAVSNENDPEEPARYYYYKIEKFELKKGNTVLGTFSIEYSADQYSGKYVPYELLPGLSTIHLELVVKGYEKNKPKILASEKYTHTFKTKPLPGKVINATLAESRPQPGKRYFLPGTSQNALDLGEFGFMLFKDGKSQCYLFNNYNTDPDKFDLAATEYLVQFRDLNNNKKYEFPCTCEYGKINFTIPQDLKPSQIHSFKLIKRLTPLIKLNPQLEGGPSGLTLGPPGGHYNPQGYLNQGGQDEDDGDGNTTGGGSWLTGEYEKKITEGGYAINKKLLGYGKKKTVDVVMYKLYFRTSQHHSLYQKMASYAVNGQIKYPASIFSFPVVTKEGPGKYTLTHDIVRPVDIPVILLRGQENFDVYDAYGYTLGKGDDALKVMPNISFETQYLTDRSWPSSWPSKVYNDGMTYALSMENANLSFPQGRTYGSSELKQISTPGLSDMKTWDYHPALFEVYYQSKYGSIQGLLPQGKSFRKPDGPLTKAEIEEALANAPEEKEFSFGNMEISLLPPSGNTNPLQPGLGLAANVDAVLPVMDLTGFAVGLDVRHTLDHMWPWFSISGKDLYFGLVYKKIYQSYTPPKGNYKFTFGDKEFTYKL